MTQPAPSLPSAIFCNRAFGSAQHQHAHDALRRRLAVRRHRDGTGSEPAAADEQLRDRARALGGELSGCDLELEGERRVAERQARGELLDPGARERSGRVAPPANGRSTT